MTDERIISIRRQMADLHKTRENYTEQWRRSQLMSLKRMIFENKAAMVEAIGLDLGRHPFETETGEIACTITDIEEILGILSDYIDPVQVASPACFAPCFSEIRYEPLLSPGVLIISPFNYPINLSLVPAAGSLASGNPTIIKMSESANHTSSLLAKLVPRCFDDSALAIVEGGAKETSDLLGYPWGLVFFTGSTRVGKIVSMRAAETLTPTILELGGKSPVYIDKSVPDMKVTADRIVWGKTYNGGQTCVAPDHVFCHEEKVDHFCSEIIKSTKRMFGGTDDPRNFDQLTRIVDEASARRLISAIQEIEESDGKKGKVIFGGSKFCDAKSRIVVPTIVFNPSLDTQVMTDEIFGPILPVYSVSSDEDAIRHITMLQGNNTPLALYCFATSDAVFEQINTCRSGTLVRNDVIIQFASPHLPIGGLGTSGSGNYHGRHSIESFSHKKSTVSKPARQLFEFGGIRYGPYGDGLKGRLLLLLTRILPQIPVLHTRRLVMSLVLAIGILFRTSFGHYLHAELDRLIKRRANAYLNNEL